MAAIRIEERFVVRAPVAPVWAFLIDPRRVVDCVPGGELHGVVDERTFDGTVRVKVGPVTLAYGGRVQLADMDPAAHRVTIVGEARERAGTDTARLTLESWLTPQAPTVTEVLAHARVDVAGHIVELGRGVLEELGHVVFQDFGASVAARIEADEARRVAGETASPAPGREEALRAVPLVLRALRAWIAHRFGRRDGGPPVASDKNGDRDRAVG